jgi:hypothetical protein
MILSLFVNDFSYHEISIGVEKGTHGVERWSPFFIGTDSSSFDFLLTVR